MRQIVEKFDVLLDGRDTYHRGDDVKAVAEYILNSSDDDVKGILRHALLSAYDRAVLPDSSERAKSHVLNGLRHLAKVCEGLRPEERLRSPAFLSHQTRYLKHVDGHTVSSPIDPEFDNDANYSSHLSENDIKLFRVASAARFFSELDAPRDLPVNFYNLVPDADKLFYANSFSLGWAARQYFNGMDAQQAVLKSLLLAAAANLTFTGVKLYQLRQHNKNSETVRAQERHSIEDFDFSGT